MSPPPDLDLDLLRAFVTVSERGGFTAAGKRLGRTQSAVSLKIARLEDLLGQRLFARTSRTLALTGEGEVLLGYARRLLSLGEETVRWLSAPTLAGELRLGVVDYFVPQRLPGVLARFGTAHPGVRLTVEVGLSDGLLASLDAGSLDLVIANGSERGAPTPGETPSRGREERTLLREPLVWVAGGAADPGWSGPEPLPLALLPAPCSYRRDALAALEQAGRAWRLVFASASLAGIQAAVCAGLAVSVVARSSVLPAMRVLGADEGFPGLPKFEIALYVAAKLDPTLATRFADFVAEALHETEGKPAGKSLRGDHANRRPGAPAVRKSKSIP